MQITKNLAASYTKKERRKYYESLDLENVLNRNTF